MKRSNAAADDAPPKAQACDPEGRASVPAGSDVRSAMKVWADGQRFSTDERGEEELLDENGTQVMMAWERPYMVRCIDALQISEHDSVLEIGFGCGYSAARIQAAQPRLPAELTRPPLEAS